MNEKERFLLYICHMYMSIKNIKIKNNFTLYNKNLTLSAINKIKYMKNKYMKNN